MAVGYRDVGSANRGANVPPGRVASLGTWGVFLRVL